MPKYASGSYTLTIFDRFGTKLQTANAKSLTHGVEMGRDLVSRGDCHSFIVQRCVHNSLEQSRWNVTPEREKEVMQMELFPK